MEQTLFLRFLRFFRSNITIRLKIIQISLALAFWQNLKCPRLFNLIVCFSSDQILKFVLKSVLKFGICLLAEYEVSFSFLQIKHREGGGLDGVQHHRRKSGSDSVGHRRADPSASHRSACQGNYNFLINLELFKIQENEGLS